MVVEKEMGIGHQEFLRTLRRALPGKALAVERGVITLDEGARRLEITLSPETSRRIAGLTLPVTRVRFSYTGYEAPERHLGRLERAFQRGGG